MGKYKITRGTRIAAALGLLALSCHFAMGQTIVTGEIARVPYWTRRARPSPAQR